MYMHRVTVNKEINMTSYIIVEGNDGEDFCKRVSELLKTGYTCAGGICITNAGRLMQGYAQAMVK